MFQRVCTAVAEDRSLALAAHKRRLHSQQKNLSVSSIAAFCQPFNGHVKTAEQRAIIQQYGDWYTSCYIWYNDEGPGRAAARPVLSSLYQIIHQCMASVQTGTIIPGAIKGFTDSVCILLDSHTLKLINGYPYPSLRICKPKDSEPVHKPGNRKGCGRKANRHKKYRGFAWAFIHSFIV